jgi:hypothetical protein
MNEGEKGICEANLRYLSQFQNPSLNKLISTLASDIPLDAERIKQSLLTSPTVSSPISSIPLHQLVSASHHHLASSSSFSEKNRIRRNISCNTDPEILSPPPHALHSPAAGENTITNLPTSYLESLFSPSVFRSPSNSAQYFTFDSHHFDQQQTNINVATPPRSQQLFKQSPFAANNHHSDHIDIQTPRFDEKEFYSLLGEHKFLDSPRNPELKQHHQSQQQQQQVKHLFENQNEISLSPTPQHSSKKTPYHHHADDGDIDPDDFLALENWLHLQNTMRGGDGDFGVDPTHYASEYSRTSNSDQPNFDHNLAAFNEQSGYSVGDEEYPDLGVNFTLPSIPKVPVVVPSLSIVDLENVLKSSRPISPPPPIPTPIPADFEMKDLPELPPLPPILVSMPIPQPPLPINQIIPSPSPPVPVSELKSTDDQEDLPPSMPPDDERCDAEDGWYQSSSEHGSMSGTYRLCKQLIKYFKEIKNPETECKDIDPDNLAGILSVRSRRIKDLFQILETLRVV